MNAFYGGGSLGGAAASSNNEFDFDPSLDPELAMAIRASAEEARAREESRVLSTLSSILFHFSYLISLLFCFLGTRRIKTKRKWKC